MSVNWEEIIRAGIKKLESDSSEVWDEWTKPFTEFDNQKISAEYYYAQGKNLDRQERYKEAIKQYTKAISVDSEYYKAYFYRGACHLKLGRNKLGIKDYTQAVHFKPDFIDGYHYRGYARKALGDLAGAIADFTKVIKLDPDKIDAYYNRAAAYSYIGNHQKAVDDFTKLIDFNPTASKHYNRGVIYYLMAEYDRAIADLTQAIKLEPKFISAYFNLGNAYYEIGDCQRASSNYRKAKKIEAELDPDDEHGFYAKGISALNRENFTEGIEYLRQAAYICRDTNNYALNLKITTTMQDLELSE